jgi:hypothetical protein
MEVEKKELTQSYTENHRVTQRTLPGTTDLHRIAVAFKSLPPGGGI